MKNKVFYCYTEKFNYFFNPIFLFIVQGYYGINEYIIVELITECQEFFDSRLEGPMKFFMRRVMD